MLVVINKIRTKIDNVLTYIIALLAGVMSCCIFWQIVCRYMLEISNNWTEEIARYSSVTMIYLGAIVLVKRKGHINIDILISCIKNQRTIAIINCIVNAATFFIMLPLIKWSYEYVLSLYKMGSATAALHIPYWILATSVFLSMLFCAAYFLIDAIEEGCNIVKGTRSNKETADEKKEG